VQLRKSWKYVVELPYVSLSSSFASPRVLEACRRLDPHGARPTDFHFSGHLDLYGPELVCSVRNTILRISGERADLQVVNASLGAAQGPVNTGLLRALSRSSFCLIARGDSYSSSLFYHAVALGCLPLVISDWFVFSFPWRG